MSTPLRKAPPCEWDPADYATHSASQLVWARELLNRLPLHGGEHILDVGCGEGKITAALARAVPRGHVLGIDSSPTMIDFARRQFPRAARPNLDFRQLDARAIQLPGRFDLVFSNAALHWVDDHPAFLRGAADALRAGGRLAVSCGGRGNAADVFTALRSVLRRAEWRGFFRGLRTPYFFHGPEEYERWLPALGFRLAQVRLVPKAATHAGGEGFAGWFRTTWLPYTQRVPADRREAFVAAVTERFLAAHPPDAAGGVRVGMIRLEIDATKRDGPG